MEDEASIVRGILAPDGLTGHACRELLGDAARHRPSGRLPGERVHDGSGAGPSLPGWDVRDAAHPELLLPVDGKRPPRDVAPGVACLDRLSGPAPSRGALGDEAEPPHGALRALPAGEHARLPRLEGLLPGQQRLRGLLRVPEGRAVLRQEMERVERRRLHGHGRPLHPLVQ